MDFKQVLQWLFQKLLPNGRAFRMPNGGIFDRLVKVINLSLDRTKTDALQILNDILPDNPNFDINDAHDWYRRLGIYDSGSVSLSDMKLAIAQKLSFPVAPLNVQSPQFIQDQLQAAGFNVFVYRNRFPDGSGGFETRTPGQVVGLTGERAVYGFIQYGEAEYGEMSGNAVTVIANYIEEDKDQSFDYGSNYRSTFYIGGSPIGEFADVPAARRIEFRQLILKLKAAQMAGFLLINYI